MKFLVLALCVCAASAATFGQSPFGAGGYKPFQGFKNTPVAPAVTAAKTVASATASVAGPAAAVAASPFVAAGAAAYEAGSATYPIAKQVVNKAYSSDSEAQIVRSDFEVKPEGGYRYVYETANGISSDASGDYKQVGEAGAVVSQGSYRYTAPDGTPVEVTYVADENGYQPQGAVLPVGPGIPEAIARALKYIEEKTREGVQKY
ncbi:hypothetical protein PYW07_015322 [Mythimna separata]|uniref:Uncharacterized protein n=1 Tax=Mythimna separata TaxID=271217 RepID=A0AAD8DYG7_MYTSE|nr:hypothetical protein PYW07_015322 [Mythimna separata]